MKVLFLMLGSPSVASARVRGYWVIEELEALGIRCTPLTGFSFLSLLKCACLIPFFDCLILQKRYGRWDYYLLKLATLLGKKTVIDLDDKYSYSDNQITLNNLVRTMRSATAVTVGSRALLEFANTYQSRSYLLPTSVKLENYQPVDQKKNSAVVLGWIGNGRAYHIDLIKTLASPLAKAAARYEVTLKLIGACQQRDLYEVFGAIPGLNVQFVDSLRWFDQGEVLRAISDFDIGLYPLTDNDFNRYKCGFKALEYMAMGIPVISSPVGANTYIISDGIDGFLVDDHESWTKSLLTLIEDKELRQSMGDAGRRKVEQKYDVRFHARALANILRAEV